MDLKLYDTLTREKRVFTPLDPSNVRMYVCGPTVYDFAHIGNARPVIVFDVLFRLLRHLYGADHVTYVRNITDVDDKINARAAEEYPDLPLNEAIRRVTEKTDKQFHEDVAALGCLPPNFEPRATEHIAEMRTLIDRLVASGNAYVAENNVLFSVPSMPDYGQLSKRPLDEMIAGARVEVAAYKKDPRDFVLWKPSDPGEPAWPSPAGIKAPGRPGWHIECSAMSWKFLGEVFDIHGGGIDLAFPHHENEIAQSRCAFHTPVMANYWMHNGFLQVEGEKMAKSAGNFVTIHELLEEWPGEVLRLAMLSSHYRQPINWTEKGVVEASEELLHWSTALWQVSEGSLMLWGQRDPSLAGPSRELIDTLLDDLNTPAALAVLRSHYEKARSRDAKALVRFAQDVHFLGLLRLDKLGVHNPYDVTSGPEMIAIRFREESKRLKAAFANGFVESVNSIIASIRERGADVKIQENGSLMFSALSADSQNFEHQIKSRVLDRDAARARKDWKESDRIRDELAKMGVVLKDTKDGTTWEIAR
ncbi:MAG: cysteine--tRNA ligase [Xanthobacteraceae bacterium]